LRQTEGNALRADFRWGKGWRFRGGVMAVAVAAIPRATISRKIFREIAATI
jgi:hypothetical protein